MMLKSKLFRTMSLCILSLCSVDAISAVADNSIVAYVPQTAVDDAYFRIEGSAPQDQINDISENQTKMIFLLHGTPDQLTNQGLRTTIVDILNDILNLPIGNAMISELNTTEISYYKSGAGDADGLHIFTHAAPSVAYGYSRTNIGNQGQFSVNNGSRLYHTEPKAISQVLSQIDNQTDIPVRNVLIVSLRPMCHCCARLLLDILHNRRRGQQNIIIISLDMFTTLRAGRPRVASNDNNPRSNFVKQTKQINQVMRQEKGNKLALLIQR